VTVGTESERSLPPFEPEHGSAGRSVLVLVALVLLVASLVPPVATEARRYEVAEAIQFCLFVVAIPALLVYSIRFSFYLGTGLTAGEFRADYPNHARLIAARNARAHSPTGSKRDFASNRACPAWPLRRPVPGAAGIKLEGQGPALLRESGDVKLERPKGQSSSSRTDGAALYSCTDSSRTM